MNSALELLEQYLDGVAAESRRARPALLGGLQAGTASLHWRGAQVRLQAAIRVVANVHSDPDLTAVRVASISPLHSKRAKLDFPWRMLRLARRLIDSESSHKTCIVEAVSAAEIGVKTLLASKVGGSDQSKVWHANFGILLNGVPAGKKNPPIDWSIRCIGTTFRLAKANECILVDELRNNETKSSTLARYQRGLGLNLSSGWTQSRTSYIGRRGFSELVAVVRVL